MSKIRKLTKAIKFQHDKRLTLWKYNDDAYIVERYDRNGKYSGFNVVRKSDGQIIAKNRIAFGWSMCLGYYFANSHRRRVNQQMHSVKLIGGR